MALTASQGALSIEFIASISASAVTASNSNQYIFQRGYDDRYYSAYLSSSNELVFEVCSGTTIFSASCPFSDSYCGSGNHYAFCYSSSSANAYVYINGDVALITSSLPQIQTLVPYTGSAFIGCSSSNGFGFGGRYITGSLDELRIWNSCRTQSQIQQYYQRHIHQEPELILYLKFNEPAYTKSDGQIYSKFLDYSKKPIDFVAYPINNVSFINRLSGSIVDLTGSEILTDNYSDPIVFDDNSEAITYINDTWTTANEFDDNNRYLITNLVPHKYIDEEISNSSYNLTNMLYMFARQLDEIKLHVKHFKNLWKHTYDEFDVIPYRMLKDAIELFGFKSFDNFPLASVDYFSKNYYVNQTEILALKQVNEMFWRTLLANLIYIYKTKGTHESIKSFLHCIGLSEDLVSIKDYSSQYSYPISSSYINRHRYSKVLNFMNNTGSYVFLTSSYFAAPFTSSFSVETLVSFKPYTYYESGTFYDKIVTSQPTVSTGSIWGINNSNPPATGSGEYGLFFFRELTSSYGDIALITSGAEDGVTIRLSATYVPIFDGNFYNVSYRRESDYHYIDIRQLNENGYSTVLYTGSCTYTTASDNLPQYICVGGFSGSYIFGWQNVTGTTETKQTEFRVWDTFLSSSELDAHCLNYTSVGVYDPENRYLKLGIHWIFDDAIQSTVAGVISPVTNYSYYKTLYDGTGYQFLTSSTSNFEYEQFAYNYLCPDLSLKWNVNKVSYSEHEDINEDIDRVDIFTVEFNLIDSLNEDMIRLFSNLQKFSNLIGIPVMSFKKEYDLSRYMKFYFDRLDKNISFKNYFDNLNWVDKFYLNIIENLVPARCYFIGEEKVIESHLLERNKNESKITKESQFHTTLNSIISARPSPKAKGFI
jgi:hypothetical protein